MRSLYEATKILLVNRIHRVPLIDKIESQNESTKENVIGVITQFKILRFLAVNVFSFSFSFFFFSSNISKQKKKVSFI